MGLLKKILNQQKEEKDLIDFIDDLIFVKSKQLEIKRHAIEHAIDLIAKTISKSEIKVYRKRNGKIKSIKNDEYYRLNVRPNENEEATSFFYKVIKKYLENEEALIICFDNNLYVADSFDCSKNILLPKSYYNIRLSDSKNNTMLLSRSFSAKEVIYLDLKESNIKETLDNYYYELGDLIGIASNKYKLTNISKFRVSYSGLPKKLMDPITNKEIDYTTYKEKLVEGLFDKEDSIILLSDNFKLDKIDFGNTETSSEWDKLEKKWSDKVAMSFNIPLDIFYGNKTDKSTSTTDFLTFGVLPHLQILEDGLNSKIIKKENYLNGEYIKINKFNMVHKDILDSAVSMDKLFSIGYTHNEINEIIGLPTKDEKWANESYITKNYENVNTILKGGDQNEK